MAAESLTQELRQKTKEKIGKDATLFRCGEEEVFSVKKVEIYSLESPTSSKKQMLSFNGRVWLSFKEPNGNLKEENYRFDGKIEVQNYNSFLGLKSVPFVCYR